MAIPTNGVLLPATQQGGLQFGPPAPSPAPQGALPAPAPAPMNRRDQLAQQQAAYNDRLAADNGGMSNFWSYLSDFGAGMLKSTGKDPFLHDLGRGFEAARQGGKLRDKELQANRNDELTNLLAQDKMKAEQMTSEAQLYSSRAALEKARQEKFSTKAREIAEASGFAVGTPEHQKLMMEDLKQGKDEYSRLMQLSQSEKDPAKRKQIEARMEQMTHYNTTDSASLMATVVTGMKAFEKEQQGNLGEGQAGIINQRIVSGDEAARNMGMLDNFEEAAIRSIETGATPGALAPTLESFKSAANTVAGEIGMELPAWFKPNEAFLEGGKVSAEWVARALKEVMGARATDQDRNFLAAIFPNMNMEPGVLRNAMGDLRVDYLQRVEKGMDIAEAGKSNPQMDLIIRENRDVYMRSLEQTIQNHVEGRIPLKDAQFKKVDRMMERLSKQYMDGKVTLTPRMKSYMKSWAEQQNGK